MSLGAVIALCVLLVANWLGLLILYRIVQSIEINQLNLMTKNSELAGKLGALSTQLQTAKLAIVAALAQVAPADPAITPEAESALATLSTDVSEIVALVPAPVAAAAVSSPS